MGVEARRIKSEKLREHQYREGYARSLEGKEVEWDGMEKKNIEHMWEHVIRQWQNVQVGGKNPKSVWWNGEIKAAVRSKEAA